LDAGRAFWYDSIICPVRDQGGHGSKAGPLHLRHRRIDGLFGDASIDEKVVETRKVLGQDTDGVGP
jgi:hypothetical protein